MGWIGYGRLKDPRTRHKCYDFGDDYASTAASDFTAGTAVSSAAESASPYGGGAYTPLAIGTGMSASWWAEQIASREAGAAANTVSNPVASISTPSLMTPYVDTRTGQTFASKSIAESLGITPHSSLLSQSYVSPSDFAGRLVGGGMVGSTGMTLPVMQGMQEPGTLAGGYNRANLVAMNYYSPLPDASEGYSKYGAIYNPATGGYERPSNPSPTYSQGGVGFTPELALMTGKSSPGNVNEYGNKDWWTYERAYRENPTARSIMPVLYQTPEGVGFTPTPRSLSLAAKATGDDTAYGIVSQAILNGETVTKSMMDKAIKQGYNPNGITPDSIVSGMSTVAIHDLSSGMGGRNVPMGYISPDNKTFMPIGELTAQERTGTKIVYAPGGSFNVAQLIANTQPGNEQFQRIYPMLTAGGGDYALQSGMVSGKALTPVIYDQYGLNAAWDKNQSALVADILAHPENYSRMGAELYGGKVQALDNRTMQDQFTRGVISTMPGRYAPPDMNYAMLPGLVSANTAKENTGADKLPSGASLTFATDPVFQMVDAKTGEIKGVEPNWEPVKQNVIPAAQPEFIMVRPDDIARTYTPLQPLQTESTKYQPQFGGYLIGNSAFNVTKEVTENKAYNQNAAMLWQDRQNKETFKPQTWMEPQPWRLEKNPQYKTPAQLAEEAKPAIPATPVAIPATSPLVAASLEAMGYPALPDITGKGIVASTTAQGSIGDIIPHGISIRNGIPESGLGILEGQKGKEELSGLTFSIQEKIGSNPNYMPGESISVTTSTPSTPSVWNLVSNVAGGVGNNIGGLIGLSPNFETTKGFGKTTIETTRISSLPAPFSPDEFSKQFTPIEYATVSSKTITEPSVYEVINTGMAGYLPKVSIEDQMQARKDTSVLGYLHNMNLGAQMWLTDRPLDVVKTASEAVIIAAGAEAIAGRLMLASAGTAYEGIVSGAVRASPYIFTGLYGYGASSEATTGFTDFSTAAAQKGGAEIAKGGIFFGTAGLYSIMGERTTRQPNQPSPTYDRMRSTIDITGGGREPLPRVSTDMPIRYNRGTLESSPVIDPGLMERAAIIAEGNARTAEISRMPIEDVVAGMKRPANNMFIEFATGYGDPGYGNGNRYVATKSPLGRYTPLVMEQVWRPTDIPQSRSIPKSSGNKPLEIVGGAGGEREIVRTREIGNLEVEKVKQLSEFELRAKEREFNARETQKERTAYEKEVERQRERVTQKEQESQRLTQITKERYGSVQVGRSIIMETLNNEREITRQRELLASTQLGRVREMLGTREIGKTTGRETLRGQESERVKESERVREQERTREMVALQERIGLRETINERERVRERESTAKPLPPIPIIPPLPVLNLGGSGGGSFPERRRGSSISYQNRFLYGQGLGGLDFGVNMPRMNAIRWRK